jgi:hypothetical protein
MKDVREKNFSQIQAHEYDKKFSTIEAGVGGLLKKVDESIRKADETLGQAFEDVDILIQKAEELVIVVD